jgi:hypothetical protein
MVVMHALEERHARSKCPLVQAFYLYAVIDTVLDRLDAQPVIPSRERISQDPHTIDLSSLSRKLRIVTPGPESGRDETHINACGKLGMQRY